MKQGQTPAVSFRQCREAARRVKAVPVARRVLDTVRPREWTGLVRDRLPLAGALCLAAGEHRLVWSSAGEFAVLQAPKPPCTPWRPPRSPKLALLRFFDTGWEWCVVLIAPMVLGLPALMVLLALVAPDWPVDEAAGWLYTGMVVYIGLALLLMAGRFVVGVVRRVDGSSRDRPDSGTRLLLDQNWSVRLCHVEDPDRAALLLRLALDRVRQLAGSDEVLLCRKASITTAEACEALTAGGLAVALDDESDLLVVPGEGTAAPVRADAHLLRPGAWLMFLMGLAIAMIAASEVAALERAACADACGDRPATYGSALWWLVRQLLIVPALIPDGGPSPATAEAQRYGWSVLLVGAMAYGAVVWSVRDYVKVRHQATRARLQRFKRALQPVSRILILTVADVERDAVIAAVAANGAALDVQHYRQYTVWPLGAIGRAAVMLAQSGPGTLGPSSMMVAAHALIEQIRPSYVILVGTCASLRPDRHQPGDVVVSTQLVVLDDKQIVEDPVAGGLEVLRGDRSSPSPTLLDRCTAATHGWAGPRVHFGPVVSSNTRMPAIVARQQLAGAGVEAIAFENEGAGVYAPAALNKVDWIMVKGVSDAGEGDKDAMRARAADAAASFVIHVVSTGGLDRPPAAYGASP